MLGFLQSMNGSQLLGLSAILAGALVLALLILASTWSATSSARHREALKRDMLARGLSVNDIERLTMTESERQVRAQSEAKAREAEVAAELKRDLIARGVPIEQVMRLVPAPASSNSSDAAVLAATICSMVQPGGQLDREAVANLIEAFLRRRDAAPPLTAIQLESYRGSASGSANG